MTWHCPRGKRTLGPPPGYISPSSLKTATLDYLEVTFEATYSAPKGRIQVWWILIPTRDVTLILSYPREWSIQTKDFVQAHKLANSTRWLGYFMFRYPSWILPGGGIAWGFLRKSDETEKQVQEVFEET